MSALPLKIEKVSGLPGNKHTCGVFSKHITLGDNSEGSLVFCVHLEGEVEGAGSFLHRLVELESKKLESSQESPLVALDGARDEVAMLVDEDGYKASFVSVFFYKNAAYISRFGDRVKVQIFKPPKSYEVKFSEGSGKVVGGELFLICTDKFVETFDSQVFATTEDVALEEIIDGLATDISVLESQGEVAAIFVQVGQKGDKPVAEERLPHEDGVKVKEKVDEGSRDDVEPEKPMDDAVEAPLNLAREDVRREGGSFGFLDRLKKGLTKFVGGQLLAGIHLRRNVVFLAILLVLFLGVSGFLTVRGKMNNQKKAEFSSHVEIARTKYNEAQAILELNREKARGLLVEADREVKAALALFGEDNGARELSLLIGQKLKETESMTSLKFDGFFDLEGKVSYFGKGSKTYFVFGENEVVEVDQSGKKIGDFGVAGNLFDGFVFNNLGFGLESGKVVKIDFAKDESGEAVSSEGAQDISVFLGNIYLLSGGGITKYVPIEGGYAEGVGYLEVDDSFGSDSRFAIDGSVWVTKGSEVFKYTRGVRDEFKIEGLLGAGVFGEIYTSADVDNVYVVDKSNSALLVVGKDGVYTKSYQSPEFSRATALFIDEESGKMYIGSGGRVLVADL